MSQWIASNARDNILNLDTDLHAVTRNVMNLSYVATVYVHSGKLKVKRYGYMGLALVRPIDVQTLPLVYNIFKHAYT